MLTAAVKTLSNATEEAVAQIAQAGDVHRQPTLLGNRSVIQITMMDPDIARIRDGWNGSFEGMPPEISDCSVREEYHSIYLTLMICLVTVGLTASLFVLTVIGWFPDLYSTSKYIGQAYSLFTNMVALVMAGFVVLSTFVPSVQACSMVAVLVHFTMFLFLSSEFLVHLDFYTAIVLPFWHEEKVASNENAATFLCVLSIIGSSSAVGGLFFAGQIKCENDLHCPIVPIMNMSLDQSTSMTVWSMTFALLGLVFLSCCHVFCVALQKLRANVVAPAAANNLSGTTRTILVDNGEGVLMYEDDVVSKEVRSAARTPFADPNFLQAIGSSFLERVTKNNEQVGKEDPPGYEEEPKPSTSKDASGTIPHAPPRSQIRFEKEVVNFPKGNQIVLKPPSKEEANNIIDKKKDNEDSDGGSGSGKDKAGSENPEDVPPINFWLEFWKALTKSFRFTLFTIASYGFLLLPSAGLALLGAGYGADSKWVSEEYEKDPVNKVFLKPMVWKTTMLCFVIVRTAQPIILAKMDKTINNKIGVIISDDVED